jgi:ABC-2 type transport system ATP-binding protein
LRPTSGQIEVLGRTWHEQPRDIQQRIGISLQETRLAEKLTVRETLAMFRSFYRRGIDPTEALARLSLQEKADARVGKLSGGQKQRLAVACAIVGDPELLFLDEPTTGLDPQSRRELWEIIRGFGVQSRTVLLTTHYLEEAERLCDRVAIVDQGQIIALGTPRELIASLGGDQVVEFSWSGGDAADAANPGDWCSLPAVSAAREEGDRIVLSVAEPHVAIPALVEHLNRRRRQLTSLSTRHASLEDVFMKLAGRRLSQEETK